MMEEKLTYMCVNCTVPVASSGMCETCSRAYGIGHAEALCSSRTTSVADTRGEYMHVPMGEWRELLRTLAVQHAELSNLRERRSSKATPVEDDAWYPAWKSGYEAAKAEMRSEGARPVGPPLEAHGIDIDAWERPMGGSSPADRGESVCVSCGSEGRGRELHPVCGGCLQIAGDERAAAPRRRSMQDVANDEIATQLLRTSNVTEAPSRADAYDAIWAIVDAHCGGMADRNGRIPLVTALVNIWPTPLRSEGAHNVNPGPPGREHIVANHTSIGTTSPGHRGSPDSVAPTPAAAPIEKAQPLPNVFGDWECPICHRVVAGGGSCCTAWRGETPNASSAKGYVVSTHDEDSLYGSCRVLHVERGDKEIRSQSDGGEPEDQMFYRDWAWVPEALREAYAFGLEDGAALRLSHDSTRKDSGK